MARAESPGEKMPNSSNSYRMLINTGGVISPWSEAKISAMDHGFLYGDSVYETVRTYWKAPFLLEPHLDRLQRSLDRVFMPLPVSRKELCGEIDRTMRAFWKEYRTDEDVVVRIVISRGMGRIGLDFSLCMESRYLIYVFELPEFDDEYFDSGIPVVISKIRRNHPRALDPAIKSGNFLNNILAFKDATDAGALEAIICNASGYLAEGTTSNIFVVKDGLVWTPRENGILDGITRAIVFEEARAAGIQVGETNIPPEALFSADEAFITSSIREVLGISSVNGRPLGEGRTGPITRRLLELYGARVETECRARGARRLKKMAEFRR